MPNTAEKARIARENGQKGGRPKGRLNDATLSKQAIRQAIQDKVAANLEPMLDAQIEHAKGIKHLMLRDADGGKFERVTDVEQIDAALATGRAFWLFTKDPSVQAFTDLMNRAADKPAEQEQDVAVSGHLVISWKKTWVISALTNPRPTLAGSFWR